MTPAHIPSFPCGKRETFATGKIEPRRITEARQVLKDRRDSALTMWAEYGGHGAEISYHQAEAALETFNATYPEPTS